MRRRPPRKQEQKPEKENSSLIKSFVGEMELGSHSQVWEPITYRGLIMFADLVVGGEEKTLLFEFLSKIEGIEKAVKKTKLKAKVFREKKDETESIDPYMVLEDTEKNRGIVIQNEPMLENQPFGILFFDGEKTVSYSETKKRVPRLFQTRGVELERSALAYLIKKPNHDEIEEALLNLNDLPETIDREFVKQVERYIKVKGIPPEGASTLKLKRAWEPEEKGSSDVHVEG